MSGFRKAKAEQAALKVGMYGPPGSGKTLTALLMAEGIAAQTGKRIAFADTERGTDFYVKRVEQRRVHPEPFDIDALYTRSLVEVLQSVRSLDPKVYGVVIIDSITHLWEAARLAYEGRQTRAGTIPMYAWAAIKKPYKDLMSFLLSSPLHVFILGRQGSEFADDEETGEMKRVGVKMKAEGETQYEPHICLRMDPVKDKKGNITVRVFAEKDRTGVLSGKTFSLWPSENPSATFDLLVKPILPLLGETQAHIATDEETAQHDGEALDRQDRERGRDSEDLLRQFSGKFQSANSAAELKAAGAALTAETKRKMLPAHVTQLRALYQEHERRLAGERTLEPVES